MDESTAKIFAAGIVRSLTGNRWSWPIRQVVDRYPVNASRRIRLDGRPVRQVLAVNWADGGELIEGWYPTNRATLQLPRGLRPPRGYVPIGGSCRGPVPWSVDVEYQFGSKPPVMAQAAIAALATEIRKADEGDNSCRLPERVTSVTREGMSWSLIDPQDFLQDGRTGVYEVDLAIKSLNPMGAKARARVFSPEYPPGERIRTVRIVEDGS
jgi:hypothetical protein